MNSWGTSLMTSLQQEFVLLITEHSPWSLSVQTVFSPSHCPFIQSMHRQLICENVKAENVENLTKVEIGNIHHSPIVHQASRLIVDGCWIGKALFLLQSSMPAIPNHPLLLPLPRNGFQVSLLHQLPRN